MKEPTPTCFSDGKWTVMFWLAEKCQWLTAQEPPVILFTCCEAPQTLHCGGGQLGVVAQVHVHKAEQPAIKGGGELSEECIADVGGIDTQHLQPGWAVCRALWNTCKTRESVIIMIISKHITGLKEHHLFGQNTACKLLCVFVCVCVCG